METPMRTRLPLPRGWKRRVKSSILHILALSHYTFAALVARAANEGAFAPRKRQRGRMR